MQNNPFRFKIFENTCQDMTWFPFTSRTARSVTAHLGTYCYFEAQFLPGIDYLTESNLYCKPCSSLPVIPLSSSHSLPLPSTNSWLCDLSTYSITSAICLCRIFTHRSSSSSKIASFSFPPEPSVLYLPRENSDNYLGFGLPPVLTGGQFNNINANSSNRQRFWFISQATAWQNIIYRRILQITYFNIEAVDEF